MTHRAALIALLLGNFLVGVTVLAPAGMLAELARGLAVSVPRAGLLVTYGAVVLCVGSPLMAWATSRLDRRLLLAGTALVITVGHLASALASDYDTLLILRLAMLPVVAVFTPQAAGTAAGLVAERERPRAIAFVFIGWSAAIAVGLMAVAFLAGHAGWQATYAAIGMLGALCFVMLAVALPRGLRGEAVVFSTWTGLLRNRLVLVLLAVTGLQLGGQFVVFPFLGPLLTHFIGADSTMVALFFAVFGVMGLIGNVVAAHLVGGWGPSRTALFFIVTMLAGAVLWTLGAGALVPMMLGNALWGLGFAAVNSMQQARLALAAPAMAGAAIALNTSCIYIGQGVGSATGGALYALGWFSAMGVIAVGMLALAALGLLIARR
ncbi:MAG: MFS transporter [Xanthobacteraceae bacterium]|nr:MAG: MFS transporter [Xanthobacteraceae bacterium]